MSEELNVIDPTAPVEPVADAPTEQAELTLEEKLARYSEVASSGYTI